MSNLVHSHDNIQAHLMPCSAGKMKVVRWDLGAEGGVGVGGEKSKTSPFNFLKTFQHLFCTLTYAKLQGATVTGVPFQAQHGV